MSTAARRPQSDTTPSAAWSSTQAYTIAVLCLVLGLAVGYLVRGSSPAAAVAPPDSTVAAPAQVNPGQLGMGGMPTGQQSAELVEKAAEPMLAALQTNPKDAGTLTKLGDLYYDARLYPKAIEYYDRALQITPANVDVRTDMATAYFYTGNAEHAISEFQKSLSYQPTHAQTLFNLGIVKLQAKNDAAGAIAAWEKMLKANPDYPQKENVQAMIAQAKQQLTK